MSDVLTVHEVAAFLRTEPRVVRQLIESGTLAAFTVGTEWRILADALLDFLKRGVEKQQRQALEQAIMNPKNWAREISRNSEISDSIESTNYAPGTFGAWLKAGMEALRAEAEGKVIDIDSHRPK